MGARWSIVDGEEHPDVKGEMGEIIEQLHDASDKHKNQAIRLTSLMEDMNRWARRSATPVRFRVQQTRRLGESKKFAVLVKDKNGNDKIVRTGDPKMGHHKEGDKKGSGHGDAKRRANFKSRHNCDGKGKQPRALVL